VDGGTGDPGQRVTRHRGGTEEALEVSIAGKHVEITDALRTHVTKRMQHIKKYFESIIHVHVVLGVEHHRHMAEVTISANGITMHGEESTDDMYSSIDKVVDKIERQLRRYKDKIISNHRVPRHGAREPLEPLQMRVDVLHGSDVESSVDTPRVIKSNRFSIKPMSVDEAVMQMDLLHQEFLVYRDSRSNRVNVLYRRADGNYGLIDPDV
jgi:putative sigma-54 modulation protein